MAANALTPECPPGEWIMSTRTWRDIILCRHRAHNSLAVPCTVGRTPSAFHDRGFLSSVTTIHAAGSAWAAAATAVLCALCSRLHPARPSCSAPALWVLGTAAALPTAPLTHPARPLPLQPPVSTPAAILCLGDAASSAGIAKRHCLAAAVATRGEPWSWRGRRSRSRAVPRCPGRRRKPAWSRRAGRIPRAPSTPRAPRHPPPRRRPIAAGPVLRLPFCGASGRLSVAPAGACNLKNLGPASAACSARRSEPPHSRAAP